MSNGSEGAREANQQAVDQQAQAARDRIIELLKVINQKLAMLLERMPADLGMRE